MVALVTGPGQWRLPDVQDEAARRIELVATAPFNQGLAGATTSDWHRAKVPFTAVREPALNQHLAYSVSVERLPSSGEAVPGESVHVAGAPLLVVLVYRIRPGAQQADYDLAAEAARRVAGVLLAYWPDLAVEPVDVWRPREQVNEWLPVELEFSITFDLDITPAYVAA